MITDDQLTDAELRRHEIIRQAFDAYRRMEDAVTAAFRGAAPMTDEQALGFAFWDAVMLYSEGRSMRPEHARCAWCVAAAGNDDAAWRAAPSMTNAEAGAHALVCPHSPLVQEVERLRSRFCAPHGVYLGSDEGCGECYRAMRDEETP